MAAIFKTDKGYRAIVARKRTRKSKTFPTWQQAKDWAAKTGHQHNPISRS